MYEELEEELGEQLGYEIRRDHDRAVELYRALAGWIWLKDNREYFLSPREAAEMVARIRTAAGCPDEDGDDYYLLGGEGQLSDWVERRSQALGYLLQAPPF